MSRREEVYIVAGIILAALSCLAAWLAVPQVQVLLSLSNEQAETSSQQSNQKPKPPNQEPEPQKEKVAETAQLSSALVTETLNFPTDASPDTPEILAAEDAINKLAGQWAGVRKTDDGQIWKDHWSLSQDGRYVEGTVRVEAGGQPQYYVVKQVQGFVDKGLFYFNEVDFLEKEVGPYTGWCLSTGRLQYQKGNKESLRGPLGPGAVENGCPASVTGEVIIEREPQP